MIEKKCGNCEMFRHCIHYGKIDETDKEKPGCEDWEIAINDYLDASPAEKREIEKDWK